MQKNLMTPGILAERWSITESTLSQWRWSGKGPHFLKIGGRVLYRVQDIEKFEENKIRRDTCMRDEYR